MFLHTLYIEMRVVAFLLYAPCMKKCIVTSVHAFYKKISVMGTCRVEGFSIQVGLE